MNIMKRFVVLWLVAWMLMGCKAQSHEDAASGETTFVTYKGEATLLYGLAEYSEADGEDGDFYQFNDWRLFWPEKVNGKKSELLHKALASQLMPQGGPEGLHITYDEPTARGLVAGMEQCICADSPINIRKVKKPDVDALAPGQMSSMRWILRLKENNERVYVFEAFRSYYFAGAAHGMYNFAYVSYDSQLDKEIKLTDVVTDTVKLRQVATQYLFEENDVKTMEQLVEKTGYFIYEPLLPLPSAFYYDGVTLHFVYQPYEIASYADGKLDIEIPTYMLQDAEIMTEYAQKLATF